MALFTSPLKVLKRTNCLCYATKGTFSPRISSLMEKIKTLGGVERMMILLLFCYLNTPVNGGNLVASKLVNIVFVHPVRMGLCFV